MSEPMKNPPARKTQTAKRNYQKEMEKVLDAAGRDSEFRLYFSTAVVRRAATTCWNICRSIFQLRCSTKIEYFTEGGI